MKYTEGNVLGQERDKREQNQEDGTWTVNVVPLPGVLSTEIAPPNA
jgi:hypothetical protein